MVHTESVTVGGHEIRQDDTINRLGNVYLPHLRGTSPHDLIREAAAEIIEKLPDAVEEDDADDLAERLYNDPSSFDAIDGVTYHSMKVANVVEGRGSVESEVTLLDWRTGARETFSPSELSNHLGKTLFVTK